MTLFQAASWGMTYACEDVYMISKEQAEKIRNKYKKIPFELRQWCEISLISKKLKIFLFTRATSQIQASLHLATATIT